MPVATSASATPANAPTTTVRNRRSETESEQAAKEPDKARLGD